MTGIRDQLAEGAEDMVRRIRGVSDMPVALGFGISRPEHVREVGRWADAAVVGSALVNVIAEAGRRGARDSRGGVRAVAEGLSIEDLRNRIDLIDRSWCVCSTSARGVRGGSRPAEARGRPADLPARSRSAGVERACGSPTSSGPLTAEAVGAHLRAHHRRGAPRRAASAKDGEAPSAGPARGRTADRGVRTSWSW